MITLFFIFDVRFLFLAHNTCFSEVTRLKSLPVVISCEEALLVQVSTSCRILNLRYFELHEAHVNEIYTLYNYINYIEKKL